MRESQLLINKKIKVVSLEFVTRHILYKQTRAHVSFYAQVHNKGQNMQHMDKTHTLGKTPQTKTVPNEVGWSKNLY